MKKATARTAAEVCRRFELGEKARSAPERRSGAAPVPGLSCREGLLHGRRPVSRARAAEARGDLVGLRLRSGGGGRRASPRSRPPSRPSRGGSAIRRTETGVPR